MTASLLRDVAIIGAAGAAGAVSRYLLAGTVDRLSGVAFPYGTLAVNVVGCLLLGLVLELSAASELLPRDVVLAAGTGFLGAFTTFSTFGVDSVRLAQAGGPGPLLANVAANVIIGLAAAWLGIAIARLATA